MKHENCFLPFCEKLIIKKVPTSFLYMRFIHSFTHVRFCSTLCPPTFKHPLQLIVIILSPPLNTIKNSPNLFLIVLENFGSLVVDLPQRIVDFFRHQR